MVWATCFDAPLGLEAARQLSPHLLKALQRLERPIPAGVAAGSECTQTGRELAGGRGARVLVTRRLLKAVEAFAGVRLTLPNVQPGQCSAGRSPGKVGS